MASKKSAKPGIRATYLRHQLHVDREQLAAKRGDAGGREVVLELEHDREEAQIGQEIDDAFELGPVLVVEEHVHELAEAEKAPRQGGAGESVSKGGKALLDFVQDSEREQIVHFGACTGQQQDFQGNLVHRLRRRARAHQQNQLK